MKNTLWSKTLILEMLNQDTSEMIELMKMFVDLCPDMLDEIETAIDDNNFIKAGKTAHKLKTSFRLWEINTVVEDSLQIENCVKLNLDFKQLKSYSKNIQSQLKIVIAEMKEEIKSHTKN